MLGEKSSLVKYSTPALVSSSSGKVNSSKKKGKEEQPHHTEDILGRILPPKQHRTDGGQLWVQTVLSTPATKIQVIQLQRQLDKRLVTQQARQELYDQCFDEIIRQITIDCRKRGLLLVRVRDEYRNQIHAYQNLYQSSINFGMRKVIDYDDKKQKISNQIIQIDKQCRELERKVNQLSNVIKNTKEQEDEKLKQKAAKHKDYVNEIMQKNQKLKKQIQNALEKNR